MAFPSKFGKEGTPRGGPLQAFFKRIRSEPPNALPRVMFLWGPERFLIDRAVALLESRLVDAGSRDFGLEKLDASESGGDGIVGAARSLAMMSPHKLVVAYDCDRLTASALGALPEYCAAPVAQSTLVLVAGSPPDIKFWKEFPQPAQYFGEVEPEALLVSANEIILKDYGKRITPEALALLVERTDTGALTDLRPHLERLALGAGDVEITPALVAEMVEDEGSARADDVAMAIFQRRPTEALDALRRVWPTLAKGREDTYLLAALAGWFRIIVRVKSQRESKDRSGQPSGSMGYYKRQIQTATPFVGSYSWPTLFSIIERLAETDLALKGWSLDGRATMESLTLWIASLATPPARPR